MVDLPKFTSYKKILSEIVVKLCFLFIDLLLKRVNCKLLMCIDNNLILHIYIIVKKYYHIYFELIHAFYIWFWNNAE